MRSKSLATVMLAMALLTAVPVFGKTDAINSSNSSTRSTNERLSKSTLASLIGGVLMLGIGTFGKRLRGSKRS